MAGSAVRKLADRLGWVAYALAVSGGRPDWSVVFGQSGPGQATTHPFTDTVPLDLERERERVAGY